VTQQAEGDPRKLSKRRSVVGHDICLPFGPLIAITLRFCLAIWVVEGYCDNHVVHNGLEKSMLPGHVPA
jgi:hypothetical protein